MLLEHPDDLFLREPRSLHRPSPVDGLYFKTGTSQGAGSVPAGAVSPRRVERLEAALEDPETAMAATKALRGLINAILIFPEERRGEVSVSPRGDLAAFLQMGEEAGGSGAALRAQNGKTPVTRWSYGCFGEVIGSLDAETGFGLWRTRLRMDRPCIRRLVPG